MKSFALSSGKFVVRGCILLLITALFTPPAFAIHSDFENQNYLRPSLVTLGVVSSVYVISEMDNAPTILASLYSMGTLYVMREWYRDEKELTELVVPFGLLTMAVLNAALFTDEDQFTHHDIFINNIAGLGLITAYAIWEHSALTPGQLRRKKYADTIEVLPIIRPNTTGFLITGITF